MKNKHTAMDIANFIIEYANNEGNNLTNYALTPLKLQKILYYVAAEYFKKFEERLFPENFQKWQYGPVVKEVYHEFKPLGFHHIAKAKATLKKGTGLPISIIRTEFDSSFLEADKDFIEIAKPVIDYYMPWKAFDLVERTHEEKAWQEYEPEIMKGIELIYSNEELAKAKSIRD